MYSVEVIASTLIDNVIREFAVSLETLCIFRWYGRIGVSLFLGNRFVGSPESFGTRESESVHSHRLLVLPVCTVTRHINGD